jgi:hypothetical protein
MPSLISTTVHFLQKEIYFAVYTQANIRFFKILSISDISALFTQWHCL